MDNLIKKDSERKTVVIGLSGGFSSFVAAYLLKIQKYDLIGVTVLQRNNINTKCFLSEDNLKKIKDFCLRLNIPHHTVEADDIFVEKVKNNWVSKKIEVKIWPQSCTPCHQMRMEILYLKMLEFKASHIGTGHSAKILKGEHGVTVHSTHDLGLDQSHLLHPLDQKVLSSLLLPLSSLGAREMEKLIQNFALEATEDTISQCFKGDAKTTLLEEFPSYNVPGEILSGQEELAPHEGEFHYYPGKEVHFNSHRLFIRGKKPGTHDLIAEDESYFLREGVRLTNVLWSQEVDRSSPFVAYLNSEIESIKVHVYPKTLNSVWIEFSAPYKLFEGEELSLYKKKGGSSKLILAGITQFCERK